MKLAVTVLSSVLLACSVTIANPVLPSATADAESSTLTVLPTATTSTYSSSSSTPNVNSIHLDGIDSLSTGTKDLFKQFLKKERACDEQKNTCSSIEQNYHRQQKLVKGLKKRVDASKLRFMKGSGNLRYSDDGEMEELKIELKEQYLKLINLEKSHQKCDSDYGHFHLELKLIKMKLVKLFFGGPCNLELLEEQFLHIILHPVIRDYLVVLGCIDSLSSRCKNDSDKDPSTDHQQRQKPSTQQRGYENPAYEGEFSKDQSSSHGSPTFEDPQQSSKIPPRSRSIKERATSVRKSLFSNIRKSIRLKGGAGSLFKQPKHQDREPLI
ncbi:hypothetical protein RTP6_007650 [Batrachochytrium dendrobatidis]